MRAKSGVGWYDSGRVSVFQTLLANLFQTKITSTPPRIYHVELLFPKAQPGLICADGDTVSFDTAAIAVVAGTPVVVFVELRSVLPPIVADVVVAEIVAVEWALGAGVVQTEHGATVAAPYLVAAEVVQIDVYDQIGRVRSDCDNEEYKYTD